MSSDPPEVIARQILARHIPEPGSAPVNGHQAPAAAPLRAFDLAALVRDGVPRPELLCGGLLYAGGLHSISGPPDSGKTTIALHWLLQHVRAGFTVAFLDEEGGAELVAEKLIALGATPEEAASIGYFPFPARNWNAYDVIVLREMTDDLKPGIILWDSAAAFLSRAGLDENSAAEVTRFWSQVLTPLAREHGAAVVVVDHDTKSSEPSRFARGSGAKLAAADVAFKVSIVQPFSRSSNGVLRMTVPKDRRGWLHRFWEIGVHTGSGMRLAFTRTAEDGSVAAAPLTPAAQKVMGALTRQPSTIRQITDRLAASHGHGLKRETVSRSLNELGRRGLAEAYEQGAGKATLWAIPAGQTCDITGVRNGVI